MKTGTILLVAAAAFFASAFTNLYGEESQTTEKPHHKKFNKDGKEGCMKQQLMKKFDKDGDGKLSDSEKADAKQARENFIKKFDKDGDGKLSDSERAEAKKACAEKFMTKRFDKDGNGKLSDSEKADAEQARESFIKKFDKDGDGKLSDTERAEAKKAYMEKRKKHKEGSTSLASPASTGSTSVQQ